jgi:hypothetical protein
VIQSSRPSKAESLLYAVTCTVGAIFQRDCTTKPVDTAKTPPPEEEPSKPTPPSENANPKHQPAPEPVTGPPVDQSPGPLDLDEAMASELSPVTPAAPIAANHYQYPAHVLSLTNGGIGGDGTVLGAQTDRSVLEATDQGWRFLGLLWYWWVVIIGAVIGLSALIKTTVTNSFSEVVEQP